MEWSVQTDMNKMAYHKISRRVKSYGNVNKQIKSKSLMGTSFYLGTLN